DCTTAITLASQTIVFGSEKPSSPCGWIFISTLAPEAQGIQFLDTGDVATEQAVLDAALTVFEPEGAVGFI
ncbi:hypothetical protein, partial [Roseovarius aestuarii]|uniref:hypothetical protein n=1 Tax=Roseovarius aestuarii TaxID=475083 RepID=UPI003626CA34